jgi:phosphatidylglycerophosphate synthase
MIFQGDKKFGRSLLADQEERLKQWLLPMVPSWLETYHLTTTTVLWSILVLLFSFLARHNVHWRWLTSLMIVMQYVTDLLDGAVGRQRDTGLVKWGFYMDHFLDYIFLCSMLVGYGYLFPQHYGFLLLLVLMTFGAFMVNSFLSFAATNQFRIAYMGIGPTEVRIVFIVVNALICFANPESVRAALPYVLGFAVFGLFVTVVRTQKELWDADMKEKGRQASEEDEKKGRRITYALYAAVAASLMLLGYVGWVVSPMKSSALVKMNDEEIHANATNDLARLSSMRSGLDEALLSLATSAGNPGDLAAEWKKLARILEDLEEIEKTYEAYHQISYVDRPQAHSQAFFVQYTAIETRYEALQRLSHLQQTFPSLEESLDAASSKTTSTVIRRSLMDPQLYLRLSAGRIYLKLVKDSIGMDMPRDTAGGEKD